MIFTNHCFGPGPVRFNVDAPGAARIFFEHRHWICAAIGAIAGIELQDNLLPGVASKNIPRGNAVEFFKIMSV